MPAKIIEDRTMVPLRFVLGQSLDWEVNWDERIPQLIKITPSYVVMETTSPLNGISAFAKYVNDN